MAYKQDECRDAIKGFSIGGDSPIEEMLLGALRLTLCFSAMRERDRLAEGMEVIPQHRVGDYRVDIALICCDQKMAIECDGHDFHEKTKTQAARDKARDRALVAAGYTVLRFTGSEIWRNPFACADEAISQLRDKVGEAAWIAYAAAQDATRDMANGTA